MILARGTKYIQLNWWIVIGFGLVFGWLYNDFAKILGEIKEKHQI